MKYQIISLKQNIKEENLVIDNSQSVGIIKKIDNRYICIWISQQSTSEPYDKLDNLINYYGLRLFQDEIKISNS